MYGVSLAHISTKTCDFCLPRHLPHGAQANLQAAIDDAIATRGVGEKTASGAKLSNSSLSVLSNLTAGTGDRPVPAPPLTIPDVQNNPVEVKVAAEVKRAAEERTAADAKRVRSTTITYNLILSVIDNWFLLFVVIHTSGEVEYTAGHGVWT
jgi:hypothetical protein